MILLIACGNPFRRDDGAGPLLAYRVAHMCRRPDLRVLVRHQLTPDLAAALAEPGVCCALFADACVGEADADVALLRPLAEDETPPPLGHHLSPAALLGLARRLYALRPPAWLATIPGNDFGFGEGLSPLAARSLARAEVQIAGFLAERFPLR